MTTPFNSPNPPSPNAPRPRAVPPAPRAKDVQELQDLCKAQEGTITQLTLALKEEISKAVEGKVAVITAEDEKALFAMSAEIDFDRTRDGNGFLVVLKGRLSHSKGKVGRFPNMGALLASIRA